jgi:hypothetical protein
MYRARPYLEETPGDIVSMKWDEAKKTLAVVYDATVHPEEIKIAIPSRLEWIGVEMMRGERSHDCSLANPFQLRCIGDPGTRLAQRSLLFIFRERK